MNKRKDRFDVPMTIQWEHKHNRKYFLDYLIKKHNFESMAEVGVRDGRTTFYLLDNNPKLVIYGIDFKIDLFYNDQVKEKYKDRLVPIEGNSSYVADKIPLVDLVFIDADHSYKGCKKDIQAYKSKVKPNGILSGHDIDYPGVNKAVNELINSYEVGPNNVWFIE